MIAAPEVFPDMCEGLFEDSAGEEEARLAGVCGVSGARFGVDCADGDPERRRRGTDDIRVRQPAAPPVQELAYYGAGGCAVHRTVFQHSSETVELILVVGADV